MDNQQDKQQQESKQDALDRGVAFDAMVRSDGWKFVRQYYENKIKALATNLLTKEESIETFEGERREIMGLRKLLSFIENDIQTVINEKSKKSTAK